MELDELKNLVRAGEFGAISLDTSIFDAQDLRLESGLLKQLEQFQDSSTKLIPSKIVRSPILQGALLNSKRTILLGILTLILDLHSFMPLDLQQASHLGLDEHVLHNLLSLENLRDVELVL